MICQPEEWVRQHVVQYLIKYCKVQPGFIAVERKLPNFRERTDIVVFSPEGKSILLVECKAPDVKLKSEVFKQTSRYSSARFTGVWWITNGLNHFILHKKSEAAEPYFLNQMPDYEELKRFAKNND